MNESECSHRKQTQQTSDVKSIYDLYFFLYSASSKDKQDALVVVNGTGISVNGYFFFRKCRIA